MIEIITELFDSFLSRYQIGLETQMTDSNFIFACVNLLYYKCHKINFKRGGSYIDKKEKSNNKPQKIMMMMIMIMIMIMMMINVINMWQQLS